jgi:hypothetical protein
LNKDETMTTFEYDRRLCGDAIVQTIRIVDLLPGDSTDPIACRLKYISLDDRPKYEAISYCWGDQVPDVEIECNKGRMKITKNLSDALRTFRKPDTIVPLWADAICINQKDKDEKTCQMPLMGKIYGQASKVKIWLREESQEEDCKTAFQLIGKLYTVSVGFKDGREPNIHLQHTLATLGLPDVFDLRWSSVCCLLKRPWFYRVWVIQEVTMA